VTRILEALGRGERRATSELIPPVDNKMRRWAAQRLAREMSSQTLRATALAEGDKPRGGSIMRRMMGFGVVLAVASLTGTASVAYGQPGTGNIVTTPGSLVTAPGNSEQAANQAGTPYPRTATYSSNAYPVGIYPRTYMGATPAYTNQIMQGYTAVNPMAIAMPRGSSAGTPYTTYYTPGYASSYVTPGYYNTQVQPYAAGPRRDLFGFGRPNRVANPASPYGSGYGTSPYGYSPYYGNTTYSPYGYRTYSTTIDSTVEDVPLAVENGGGSSYQSYATSSSIPDGCPCES
jgi:hypothetical protein